MTSTLRKSGENPVANQLRTADRNIPTKIEKERKKKGKSLPRSSKDSKVQYTANPLLAQRASSQPIPLVQFTPPPKASEAPESSSSSVKFHGDELPRARSAGAIEGPKIPFKAILEAEGKRKAKGKMPRTATPPPAHFKDLIERKQEARQEALNKKGWNPLKDSGSKMGLCLSECLREGTCHNHFEERILKEIHEKVFCEHFEVFFYGEMTVFETMEYFRKAALEIATKISRKEFLLELPQSSLRSFYDKFKEEVGESPLIEQLLKPSISVEEFARIIEEIKKCDYGWAVLGAVGGEITLEEIKKLSSPETVNVIFLRIASFLSDLGKVSKEIKTGRLLHFDPSALIPLEPKTNSEILLNWFRSATCNVDKITVNEEVLEFGRVVNPREEEEETIQECRKNNLKILLYSLFGAEKGEEKKKEANPDRLLDFLIDNPTEICIVPELYMQGNEIFSKIQLQLMEYFNSFQTIFKVKPGCFLETNEGKDSFTCEFEKFEGRVKLHQRRTFSLYCPESPSRKGVPVGYFRLYWTFALAPDGKSVKLEKYRFSKLHFKKLEKTE